MNKPTGQSLGFPDPYASPAVLTALKAAAFDQAAVGLALIAVDGRWIDVNQAFAHMLGASRSALLASSFDEFTPEDDLGLSRHFHRQLTSGAEASVEFEKRYRRADGELIWVSIRASFVRPANGLPPLVVTQVRDITVEKATREALAESEARLNLALEGADLGLWHWDIDEHRFEFSARAASLLGYRPDQVAYTLRSIIDLAHPDDRGLLIDAMSQHLDGQQKAFEHRLRMRRSRGTYCWMLVKGRVTKRDERTGKPLRVSGTMMDVTRWKALERRLTMLATTDKLTGLLNRRSGAAVLDATIENSRKDGQALSLVLFDIDHFKALNDQFGHEAGDRALEQLGRVLKQSLRSSDRAIRWGGEEFVLVLPSTPAHGASAQARRLFQQIESMPPVAAGAPPLTASMGVVTWHPGEDAQTLVKRADRLMYDAKQAGRARIMTDHD
ncbi:MAG: sensor domain-containing diguanylate cyclase [Wenzhouxiangella sp.]